MYSFTVFLLSNMALNNSQIWQLNHEFLSGYTMRIGWSSLTRAAACRGGFTVIAEITRCHTFTKEIDYASALSQYFDENFYCKKCLPVFSAKTRKSV